MQCHKVKAGKESEEKRNSWFGALFSGKGLNEHFDAKALHDRIQQATESLSKKSTSTTDKVEKSGKHGFIEVPDDNSPSLNITESECIARYGQVSFVQMFIFLELIFVLCLRYRGTSSMRTRSASLLCSTRSQAVAIRGGGISKSYFVLERPMLTSRFG